MEPHLSRANLDRAYLDSGNLLNANLDSANLAGANLVSANLAGANLDSANLNSANLPDANLDSANLAGANLDSANLYRANLAGAILLNTYLSSAQNLSLAQLEGTWPPLLCGTTLPANMAIDPNRDCGKLPQALADRYPGTFETVEAAAEYVRQQVTSTQE